jgi:hypothetical protein
VRRLIANHDEQVRTAHDLATDIADHQQLPERVRWALDRRTRALHTRQHAYRQWIDHVQQQVIDRQRWRDLQNSRSRDRSTAYGIDL